MSQTRALVRKAHLWLGVISAAPLAVIALTGALLAFWPQLDGVFHPRFTVPSRIEAARMDFDALARAAKAAAPDARLSYFWRPYGEGAVIAGLRAGEQRFALAIHPETGVVLDKRGDSASGFLFRLHASLLAGETGKVIVLSCGLGLLISLGLGLYLWAPQMQRSLRFALSYRGGRHALRDAHVITGVYASALLMLVAVTGLAMLYPAITARLLAPFGVAEPPHLIMAPQDQAPLALSAAFARAQAAAPEGQFTDLFFIEGPADHPYEFRFRLPNEALGYTGRTRVNVDRFSGEVLSVWRPDQESAAAHIFEAMRPLHSGAMLGWPGRFLQASLGLALLGFILTGIWMFVRRKRRKPVRIQSS